jgi:hypothetical protein
VGVLLDVSSTKMATVLNGEMVNFRTPWCFGPKSSYSRTI